MNINKGKQSCGNASAFFVSFGHKIYFAPPCFVLCLPQCNTDILLDTQSVYHPEMLAAISCGNKLYASQQPESPMSQKVTFTHLTEPPHTHIGDILSPLLFQKAVVTAHLLPLSTQHSHRDSEILVVQSD